MGLEPYEGRYTLQLQDWTERAYKKRKIDYVVVPGTTIDDSKAISVGCLLYTSPSPRDRTRSRMPSSA